MEHSDIRIHKCRNCGQYHISRTDDQYAEHIVRMIDCPATVRTIMTDTGGTFPPLRRDACPADELSRMDAGRYRLLLAAIGDTEPRVACELRRLNMTACPTNLAQPTGSYDPDMASLYRRGRKWWVSFTGHDGKRRAVSTGCSDKRIAQDVSRALEAKHAMVRLGIADPAELDLAQRQNTDPATLLDAFAPTVKGQASHRSTVVSWVREFLTTERIVSCRAFSTDEIATAMTRWDKANSDKSMETRRPRLFAVRRFADWLVDRRYATCSRCSLCSVPDNDGKRVQPHRALTPDEAERLCAGRDGLYYRFRLWTGLRGTEAVQVVRGDLELGPRPALKIRREIAKNALACVVPLAGSLADVLRDEVGMRHPDAPIFDQVSSCKKVRNDRIRAALKEAGIVGANDRSIRMTFCTWLEAAGIGEDDRCKLRRDKGAGHVALARWTYSDSRQTLDRMAVSLATMERWHQTRGNSATQSKESA